MAAARATKRNRNRWNGWTGQMLRVNLSTGKVSKESLGEELAWNYMGARGLGTKILYDEVDPAATDPFGEENKLLFVTGPLTGTLAPTGARYVVMCKSPLTGAIGCSNSGGYWAPELKFAGYDAVIVEGKAKQPVYLWINDENVELREASSLWGKTVGETDDLLREWCDPDAKVACIGPAGENRSLIACVLNDKHRAAGRCGVGAVMGDKKLKAIVVRGTVGFTVADPKAFHEAVHKSIEKLQASPVTSELLPKYGTDGILGIINEHGLFPTRNFQTGVFEGASKITGQALVERKLLVRNKGCFACAIACGRSSKVPSGKYAGVGEGPEYENAWGLGGAPGVDDLEAITKANYLCNDLGLDPISAGSTIACAMEMYEKGIVPREKFGDVEPRFGNADAVISLLKAMAYREGIGDELADGSYRFADRYGHPDFSISVKKQELAAYDPRGAKGMALTYATSNRGACHLKSYTVGPEIFQGALDPLKEDGKAEVVKAMQDTVAAVDSTGMCLFVTFAMLLDDFCPLLNAAVGANWKADDLLIIGERIFNLERLFNLKAGFTRADDNIPKRLTDEPLPEDSGPAKGQKVNFQPMLEEWYQLRGYDSEGRPTEETLRRLGL